MSPIPSFLIKSQTRFTCALKYFRINWCCEFQLSRSFSGASYRWYSSTNFWYLLTLFVHEEADDDELLEEDEDEEDEPPPFPTKVSLSPTSAASNKWSWSFYFDFLLLDRIVVGCLLDFECHLLWPKFLYRNRFPCLNQSRMMRLQPLFPPNRSAFEKGESHGEFLELLHNMRHVVLTRL